VELAEALWRTWSQAEEVLARHAKVARDLTATVEETLL